MPQGHPGPQGEKALGPTQRGGQRLAGGSPACISVSVWSPQASGELRDPGILVSQRSQKSHRLAPVGGGGESDPRCCKRSVMKSTNSFWKASEQPWANGFASWCSHFFPFARVSELQPLPVALYVL